MGAGHAETAGLVTLSLTAHCWNIQKVSHSDDLQNPTTNGSICLHHALKHTNSDYMLWKFGRKSLSWSKGPATLQSRISGGSLVPAYLALSTYLNQGMCPPVMVRNPLRDKVNSPTKHHKATNPSRNKPACSRDHAS